MNLEIVSLGGGRIEWETARALNVCYLCGFIFKKFAKVTNMIALSGIDCL
jgi:hypothetical protein